jgi:hypothetical protein
MKLASTRYLASVKLPNITLGKVEFSLNRQANEQMRTWHQFAADTQAGKAHSIA